MAAFCQANAQNPIDNKDGARIFVQKFYDWYGKVYANTRHIEAQYVLVKQKPQYLDEKLLNAIIADHRASARRPREIIGLYFDPFTYSLDNRKGFQTGLVTQKGNKFFIDVHDIRNERSKKAVLAAKLITSAEVIQRNGNFVFSNFIYPKIQGHKSDNLLSMLDSLHKDRVKHGRRD
jgi:hypothetical protein